MYVLVPSQVNGSGESTVDTNVAGTITPHTSVTVGVAGAVALAKHSTELDPLAGTTGAAKCMLVLYSTLDTLLQGSFTVTVIPALQVPSVCTVTVRFALDAQLSP